MTDTIESLAHDFLAAVYPYVNHENRDLVLQCAFDHLNRARALGPEWLPMESAPRDGSVFWFRCDDGLTPGFVGTFRESSIAGVVKPRSLLYLSYTDTGDKNLFRSGAFIKCGMSPVEWHPLPQPPKEPGQ